LLAAATASSPQPGRLEGLARELALRVFSVWVEHFAWHGREQLGADLVLGEAEEDALADALADLLWDNRDALRTPQEKDA
jgi:hypothetical protein